MWMKNGKIYRTSIVLDGRVIYNPTDEQLKSAGYTWVEPQADPHEWVDKELFVTAVYSLVPAEAIPAVLAEAETAKAAIAGMALLTTAAAPGNLIDIADKRVEQWLSASGVTVEQVRETIKKLKGYE